MSHFDKNFTDFFKELAASNNSAWFADNKKRYEVSVKNPFKSFVEEMIARIQKHEPEITIGAPDAIFRINKDVRFSKDKIPYNTHVSANISSQGRKSKEEPGFFFQLSHEGIMLYGGAYMLEPIPLQNLRTYIANNLKTFATLYNDKNFKEKYGEIQGEKNKKLPDNIKPIVEKEPLLANKQFYYTATLKPAIITQKDLPEVLMEYYKAGKKMNDFLKEGFKG